jgi:hypothetical protein
VDPLSATGLDIFDKILQTTHGWLDEISAAIGPDRPLAYRGAAGTARGAAADGLTGRHILNTPNLVSGIGALSAAEKASASTRRVSVGAMMPSSHSRAVAW